MEFEYKFNGFVYLQELEQIEEHYKQETRDLLSTVKKLQDENRKLASSLAAATERDSAFSEDGKFIFFCQKKIRSKMFLSESYFEVELVNRLQSVIDKQRGQIKKIEQSNIEYKSDNEGRPVVAFSTPKSGLLSSC